MASDNERLIHELWRGGSFGYLWTIDPAQDRKKRTHWLKVGEAVPITPRSHETYFGIHPTAARGTAAQRSTVETVAALNCLFAELDAKDFGGDKPRARAHAEAFTPRPSVIVDSGGGYHCYWLLRDTLALTSDTIRREARAVQAAWVSLFGGDDAAKDLARVLRVPGTVNHKYRPGRPVTIIRAEWDTRYTFAELAARAQAHSAPRPARSSPTPASSPAAQSWRDVPYIRAAIDRELATLRSTPEGGRNKQLNYTAHRIGQWIPGGYIGRGEAEGLLSDAATACGLSKREADKTIASGLNAGIDNKGKIPAREARTQSAHTHTPPPPDDPRDDPRQSAAVTGEAAISDTAAPFQAAHPYTDIGNAERLRDRHGASMRYCYTWDQWLVWDGRRWARDERGEAMRRAKDTARAMLAEAAAVKDDGIRAALVKHERNTESIGRLRAMLEAAQSLLPVTANELDCDPWLFNCANGTVDLRSGELRPHNPADLITKLSPVRYDPAANSPAWEEFLSTATRGDKALADFLRRAAGYTLTGDTSEEKLLFVHGPGGAGKSTFIETLRATMGEYATQADFETFLKRKGDSGVRNDIARLIGARLCASIEVDEGKRLAEGLVKALTGGDTVTARFLFKEAFEFVPDFKLWLIANHAPRIDADDTGMWRRILRVPFENAIPAAKRDPKLKGVLRDTERTGPAVLAWAVRGCLEWQRSGLAAPAVIERATEELRTDMDPLKDFLGGECVLHPAASVNAADLRAAYDQWATATGIDARWRMSTRTLADKLKARGLTQDKGTGGARIWRGIGLAAEGEI